MPSMQSFGSRRIDDPQSLKVVRALEAVGAGRSTVQLPAMTTSFRDDLRAQLVAVTPRLVAEGVHPGTETAPRKAASTSRRASGADRAAPAARPSIRTRPMTVLVAGAAVVVLGLGGATWLARGALPGDPLYGLKRAAEGVDVSLSGSDVDKGHALLSGAEKRVDEVSELIDKPQSMAFGPGTSAAGGLSDSTIKLVVSTLDTADTDTQKGIKLIGEDYVATGNTAGLALVKLWAGGPTGNGVGGQVGRIQSLAGRIPSGSARESADASLRNINTGYQRALDLLGQAEQHITCSTRPTPDAFGPKPCGVTAPSTPSQPTTAPTSGATTSNPGGGVTTAPTSGPATTPVAPGSTPAGTLPSSSATPAATTTTSGAAPISIDSCGIQVTLPVAGVSLGTCPPNR